LWSEVTSLKIDVGAGVWSLSVSLIIFSRKSSFLRSVYFSVSHSILFSLSSYLTNSCISGFFDKL
jgi:hypothetical protein